MEVIVLKMILRDGELGEISQEKNIKRTKASMTTP